MKKIITLGIGAAFLFSSTFAINRWLNVHQGGFWYWTACLRYVYGFIFLSVLIIVSNGFTVFKETIRFFLSTWYFWLLAGGIGFGVFYMLLCYAASFSPGWVLATTWQLTILMTPLVIFLLGNRVPTRGFVYLLIMFCGVLVVNYQEFNSLSSINPKFILPILFAAFCYPLGNTLCKYACEGKYPNLSIDRFAARQNVFCQILLMTLGALPVLAFAGIFLHPSPPNNSQLLSTAVVALLTGVLATGLLYKARQTSKNDTLALAAADGTQALEAPLALLWECLLFGGVFPAIAGIIGLLLVIVGIILFYHSHAK